MPREYLFILISISFHKDFVLFYFIFSIFFFVTRFSTCFLPISRTNKKSPCDCVDVSVGSGWCCAVDFHQWLLWHDTIVSRFGVVGCQTQVSANTNLSCRVGASYLLPFSGWRRLRTMNFACATKCNRLFARIPTPKWGCASIAHSKCALDVHVIASTIRCLSVGSACVRIASNHLPICFSSTRESQRIFPLSKIFLVIFLLQLMTWKFEFRKRRNENEGEMLWWKCEIFFSCDQFSFVDWGKNCAIETIFFGLEIRSVRSCYWQS